VTTNDETIRTPEPSGDETNPSAAGATSEAGAIADAAAIANVVAERDQLREQLLRTAADFDNYRKRTRRDVEDAKQRGKDDAVKDILPVFDNLERAVAAADSAQSIASVVEGVKMVLKLFEDTSERLGLTRIKTVGERFDPAIHEAIQQQETDAHPPGTILNEIVPGYTVGARLLRAAMVVVARKSAGKPADTGSAAGEGHGNGVTDGSHNG
jgi:molecular chaperone GrpE